MVMDGVKGRFEAGGERAHTTSHPPVIKAGKFKAGIGELPAGQVLQRVAGLLEQFTGADGEIMAGVLDGPLDTSSETVGEYVVHGTVKDRLLTKGDGTALDAADLFKLYEIGIYPE